jgi:hypothetical protein
MDLTFLYFEINIVKGFDSGEFLGYIAYFENVFFIHNQTPITLQRPGNASALPGGQ